ncbi:MAG: ectonucleotide pyrophosphatase/phosphodiesterase [Leadbetterella sp.]|nr:ectonucleotide pyrophosphatase/phosphodiesterase [Leadbetterella sp.]
MKKLLLLLLSTLHFQGMAQADTTQYREPGRKNAPGNYNKPYVILISADGFRYDYARKHGAANLLKLAETGISAKGMIPSYPSNTFPNHYTLVTGMYPSTHGLIDNSFYDPHRDQTYTMGNKAMVTDSSWYGGLPLWGLAEKNGLVSASLFWVASESRVAGIPPTYHYKYHNEFSNDRKVEIVKEWLQLPEEIRPHLITLYFPEVDSQGHYYGPDSKEAETAVQQVDRAIGKLVEEVEKLGLPEVNFVFVSDHGMILSDVDNPLKIPEAVNNRRFVLINSYSLLRVHALNPDQVMPVYQQLKKEKNKDYKVYLTRRFPKRLHFRTNADDRLGDILLLPRAPKVFEAIPTPKRKYPGTHGYDPKKVPDMKATFMAWGPAFKPGKTIGTFENVHVYPMVAKILGLPVTHAIDGKERVLDKVLKDQ